MRRVHVKEFLVFAWVDKFFRVQVGCKTVYNIRLEGLHIGLDDMWYKPVLLVLEGSQWKKFGEGVGQVFFASDLLHQALGGIPQLLNPPTPQ